MQKSGKYWPYSVALANHLSFRGAQPINFHIKGDCRENSIKPQIILHPLIYAVNSLPITLSMGCPCIFLRAGSFSSDVCSKASGFRKSDWRLLPWRMERVSPRSPLMSPGSRHQLLESILTFLTNWAPGGEQTSCMDQLLGFPNGEASTLSHRVWGPICGSGGGGHGGGNHPCHVGNEEMKAGRIRILPFFILSRVFSGEKVHSINLILKNIWHLKKKSFYSKEFPTLYRNVEILSLTPQPEVTEPHPRYYCVGKILLESF